MYLRKDPEILLRETKERVGFPVKWSSTGGFAYGSIFFVFSWISLFTRGIFIETLSVSFLIEFFFMGKDATMEATALRFRHYTPRDEALRSLCVGKEDIEASVAATVEKELSIIETYRTKFEDPSLERVRNPHYIPIEVPLSLTVLPNPYRIILFQRRSQAT
mmetsp:Transcript_6629/g.13444  ORF Transcript_6629/g.13444 Transcript_6629/m.13444 type:complete len:162 (+) Transcript_6629:720-1205(+)